jgi:hypothetical protein
MRSRSIRYNYDKRRLARFRQFRDQAPTAETFIIGMGANTITPPLLVMVSIFAKGSIRKSETISVARLTISAAQSVHHSRGTMRRPEGDVEGYVGGSFEVAGHRSRSSARISASHASTQFRVGGIPGRSGHSVQNSINAQSLSRTRSVLPVAVSAQCICCSTVSGGGDVGAVAKARTRTTPAVIAYDFIAWH